MGRDGSICFRHCFQGHRCFANAAGLLSLQEASKADHSVACCNPSILQHGALSARGVGPIKTIKPYGRPSTSRPPSKATLYIKGLKRDPNEAHDMHVLVISVCVELESQHLVHAVGASSGEERSARGSQGFWAISGRRKSQLGTCMCCADCLQSISTPAERLAHRFVTAVCLNSIQPARL